VAATFNRDLAAPAGGNKFEGPFGVLYTPNITSDLETGIGAWSETDIVNALRLGVRPDGSQLHPIMPYMAFSNLSDQDAYDLAAALKMASPVSNEAPASELVAAPAPFTPANAPPTTAPTEGAERGAYIVAVANCGRCHTPRGENGAPDPARFLAGAQLEDTVAPNLTPHESSNISFLTEEQIANFLLTGIYDDGTSVELPMKTIIDNGTSAALRRPTRWRLRSISRACRRLPPSNRTIGASDGRARDRHFCVTTNKFKEGGAMNHRTKGEIVFVIIVFVIFAPLLAACGGEAIPPTVAPLAATPALSTFTPAPVAVVTQPAAPASTNVRTFAIDATQSEARFFINEVLFGAPSEVKGATNQITGAIDIDLDTPANTVVSQIVINARELKTDRNLRDRRHRRFILQSADDKYQFITFTPTNITGLPAVTQAGDSFSFEITGDLQIRDHCGANNLCRDADCRQRDADYRVGAGDGAAHDLWPANPQRAGRGRCQ
jgi:mono/diheme cytochrome c family protein/polyisoprenoid-binding protein YceI